MARRAEATSIEVFIIDRDRVNDLAAQLTADGPGRFGQAETIRFLLDFRENTIELLAGKAERGAL